MDTLIQNEIFSNFTLQASRLSGRKCRIVTTILGFLEAYHLKCYSENTGDSDLTLVGLGNKGGASRRDKTRKTAPKVMIHQPNDKSKQRYRDVNTVRSVQR